MTRIRTADEITDVLRAALLVAELLAPYAAADEATAAYFAGWLSCLKVVSTALGVAERLRDDRLKT